MKTKKKQLKTKIERKECANEKALTLHLKHSRGGCLWFYTMSGRLRKVVASHSAVARLIPTDVALIYTMHEALRGYCPWGWGVRPAIGSTVSDGYNCFTHGCDVFTSKNVFRLADTTSIPVGAMYLYMQEHSEHSDHTTSIPVGAMYLHARTFWTLAHMSSIPMGAMYLYMQERSEHSLIRHLYPSVRYTCKNVLNTLWCDLIPIAAGGNFYHDNRNLAPC